MKASWLIESDVFDPKVRTLIQEVERQGMRAVVLSDTKYFDVDYFRLFGDFDCVIFHGCLDMARHIMRKTDWTPGAYCTPEAYNCTSYYPKLGKYLLAQNYAMLPYGDLFRSQDFLYGTFGIDGTIFIRPNSGLKPFTGQTVYTKYFCKGVEYMGYGGIKPSDLVVVSEPRNIEAEWRFVVVDGKVITGSLYRFQGESADYLGPGYSEESFEFAQEVADESYVPDRAYTIDVCKTYVGNYYLLEINSFSCAGLYHCDLEAIVREVSRVALEDWRLANC